jgi:hypothetical protein
MLLLLLLLLLPLLLLLLLLQALGDAAAEPLDIGDVPDLAAALTAPSLDGLIVGAPTWNTGAEEGRSGTAWDDVLAQVKGEQGKGGHTVRRLCRAAKKPRLLG